MYIRFVIIFGVVLLIGSCTKLPYQYKAIDGNLAWVNTKTGEVIDSIDPKKSSAFDLITAVPIIDIKTPGFDEAAYKQDSRECRDLARQVRDRTLETAITGAVIGAATGAAVGATVGIPKRGVMVGAAGAGIPGLAYGYTSTMTKRDAILVKCLEGRGHRVLGLE